MIPLLLLQGGRLVKTRRFRDPVYVGDPANVVSIFNNFEVDEIAIIDIEAARRRTRPDLELIERIGAECFIPMSYGGGVETVGDARAIISVGVEKVIVNSSLLETPAEIHKMVESLGSQAVIGAVDIARQGNGILISGRGATRPTQWTLSEWCSRATEAGVGEILVTSIDREGTRSGYDLELIQEVASLVDVPVIAHGGAGTRQDLVRAVEVGGASAVAAASQFVFMKGRESVLINYPTRAEAAGLFGRAQAGDATSLRGDAGPKYLGVGSGFSVTGKVMCTRCLMTSDVPGADLARDPVCHYCHLHDGMQDQYPTGVVGRIHLQRFAQRLKDQRRPTSKYDCILGVSGGCDSSYLAHLLIGLGLRPLAVHFDNTWNSPTATANIHAVLGALDIDLETYVVDNEEYDDIYRSFMLAGVRDVEAPTDIGFMGVLYRSAEKHGIRHIVEGHSFRTEGVSPLGWLYMDGGYIRSVHEAFGSVPMRTFPNLEFGQFVRWAALSRIERHRPLYYVDYTKEDAKRFLTDTYGWQWYGGHHLENRFTAFYHTYLLPQRFGIDFRQVEYSALIRSGQLDRDEGLQGLSQERVPDPELLALVKKRLRFTDEEFEFVMTQPFHTHEEFDTYKSRFERLRPFFWALYKAGRVPKSFYVKFCC